MAEYIVESGGKESNMVLDCILKQMGYRKKESGVLVFSSDGCEIH